MTVKEFIEILNKFNEDRIVILSKDSEGNGFSPLEEASAGSYRPETSWVGEVESEPIADTPPEYIEDDVYRKPGKPAVVLWPVN